MRNETRPDAGMEPNPWSAGYALARQLRQNLELDDGPIPTLKSLAEAIGEDLALLRKATRPVGCLTETPLVDGVVTRNANENPAFAFRHRGEVGRRFHYAIAQRASQACPVPVLPAPIGGQRDADRPAGCGAGGDGDRIADRFVAAAALVEHACQHRDVEIGVVVDANVLLLLVKAMQASDVLGNGAAPRNGHGQEQGVEAGIVEPLPDEPTRCQQYLAGDVLGGPRQSGLERLAAHAAPEYHHTRTDRTKPARKGLQVIDPFGQNEGGATRSHALAHIGADRRIASVVLRQVLANALILDAGIAIGLAGHAKAGRSNQRLVGEGPAGRLPPGVHAMPDGATVHEQGRVLAILATRMPVSCVSMAEAAIC